MKYTFSDDEDDFTSDNGPTRKSNRLSGVSTPAEPAGPTFTASGRQVRSRVGGAYGESLLSGQRNETASTAPTPPVDGDDQTESNGRPQRNRTSAGTNGLSKSGPHIEGYNSVDEMDDESEAASSGNEWDGGDDANDYADDGDDDEPIEDESSMDQEDDDNPSLVVQLRYGKGKTPGGSSPTVESRHHVSKSPKISVGEQSPNHQTLPNKSSPGAPVHGELKTEQLSVQPASPVATKDVLPSTTQMEYTNEQSTVRQLPSVLPSPQNRVH
jgi:hypothetical protein